MNAGWLANRNETKEAGFTLVELLVVILIIGILAAIAIPMFLNQRKAAAESALKSDLKNAGTIMEGKGKFTGSLPDEVKKTDGVVLTAMRKSSRNNQVPSSQFVDGNSANWSSFQSAGGRIDLQVVTGSADGYQGMNYRRAVQSTAGGSTGQWVRADLPESVKEGDKYTVGVAMRHNYTGCRNINIEFKGAGGTFSGGIDTRTVCPVKDQWQYYEFTGEANGVNAKDVTHIVMSMYGSNLQVGDTFDVTGAVIVKGTEIDAAGALDMNGYDFCVQGYHESDPDNIWSYSNIDGGLNNKRC